MACRLTVHHPMRCMCPARTPTTLFLFSSKASNPNWGMHPLLNLWERPVKSLGTMLWVSLSLTLHMPLRDQRLVACLNPNRPLQPLHFSVGRLPPAMEEREKFDLIKERLWAIEGICDYHFAHMAELCLVPDVIIPPKFKVPDFNKYKGTPCPMNHLKMYCRKMGAYSKDRKTLDALFSRELGWGSNHLVY